MRNILVAVTTAIMFASSADAALVTLDFSGPIVSSAVADTGPSFNGSVTYDTSTPAFTSNANFARYRAIASGTWSSGSVFYTISPTAASYFQVGLSNIAIFFINGADSVLITLDNEGTNVFDSPALPDSVNGLMFTQKFINISDATGTVFGRITALAPASVPEPSTWGMFIGGFGLIGGVMRRRYRMNVTYN